MKKRKMLNIIEKLASNKDCYIRSLVARNLNTPTDILTKLADDEDWFIRQGVALNPNLTKLHLLNITKIV